MEEQHFSIKEAAMQVGVKPCTINNWYRWFESSMPKPVGLHLPKYTRSKKRAKMFTVRAISSLIRFKAKLPRGAMAQFNAGYNWGKRGEQALLKKQIDIKEVKEKIKRKENENESTTKTN